MIDQLWLLICSGLVLLMQAGFMCLESGLTRSKNSINVAVKNLSDFGVSVSLFWLMGYGVMFGLSRVGAIGSTDFFFNATTNPETATFFLYQAMFCGTATTIISGAIAERLKFSAYMLIVVLVSGLIYPLYGHWAWNEGGWLYELGFLDFAGSTVVHGMGAWISLAALIVVGARRGKFTEDGEQKIQGSNLPFAVLGTLLLWVGWIGFNGGSTFALNEEVPNIIVNTILAGVAGMVAAMILSQIQTQRVEVEDLINGSLAGLVAITACCNVVSNPLAVIIGITAAAVAKGVSVLLRRQKIDDAVDAIAVHGGAGMWGTLCVGLFGNIDNRYEQILIQLLGIGVALLWGAGLTWVILVVLNRWRSLRVLPEEENIGLNISEHGAKTDAYDLFQVMDHQANTQDLTLRVPVEPFTEVGHIATRYNQVMDSLERNHRTNAESLEELYTLTASLIAVIENQNYNPDAFDEFGDRPDELGVLARSLQQLLELISHQEKEAKEYKFKQQNYLKVILSEIFHNRFDKPVGFYEAQLEKLQIDEMSGMLANAITVETFEEFTNALTRELEKW
ncbi:ammonium transporter [[Leptolyngbya] sp. PCC 7376]|uniref:ammonium transporter n=1 Tax=[Leptolyngbya] sp. PCC 7376 TaxID=111781 RepID=UPI00029F0F9D|nr:ammonium transporter [[Leptolyngbya] sp. PCC 7376]AFY40363.1 ammonium transporter [[Leptolyngbya] sp. PCC 7376]